MRRGDCTRVPKKFQVEIFGRNYDPPYFCLVEAPKKETIEITGKGGAPVYASANVLEAQYISGNEAMASRSADVHYVQPNPMFSLEPRVYYCRRREGVTSTIPYNIA